MEKMEQPLKIYDLVFHQQCHSGRELSVLTVWEPSRKQDPTPGGGSTSPLAAASVQLF